jgi:hypothetical protein
MDLAIGVPGESFEATDDDEAGIVHILYGTPSGVTSQRHQIFHQGNLFSNGGAEQGDRFGAALAAGDFDGNGRTDLAVGAPGEDISVLRNATPVNLPDAGEVNVIYASNTAGQGLTAAGAQAWNQDMVTGNVLAMTGVVTSVTLGVPTYSNMPDKFGASLTAFNFGRGDADDLAIGVPFADVGTVADAGAVNVMHGPLTPIRAIGPSAQYWHQNRGDIVGGSESRDHFGGALN